MQGPRRPWWMGGGGGGVEVDGRGARLAKGLVPGRGGATKRERGGGGGGSMLSLFPGSLKF